MTRFFPFITLRRVCTCWFFWGAYGRSRPASEESERARQKLLPPLLWFISASLSLKIPLSLWVGQGECQLLNFDSFKEHYKKGRVSWLLSALALCAMPRRPPLYTLMITYTAWCISSSAQRRGVSSYCAPVTNAPLWIWKVAGCFCSLCWRGLCDSSRRPLLLAGKTRVLRKYRSNQNWWWAWMLIFFQPGMTHLN